MSQDKIEGKVNRIIPLTGINTGYSEYGLINGCESR